MPEIRKTSNLDELAHMSADHIYRSIHRTLSRKDDFCLVLTGGRTPRKIYERLAQSPYDKDIPWSKIKIFWVDERFVAMDHPESNYSMARETLLGKVPIPSANIYPMVKSTEDLKKSCMKYEENLKYIFHVLPRFDMIFLGMGEDGHVASHFPDSSSLQEESRWVIPVTDSPKPPPQRLTLSFPIINNAEQILFFISGEEKAGMVRKVLKEPLGRYPAQYVWPAWGTVVWWLDQAAYKECA